MLGVGRMHVVGPGIHASEVKGQMPVGCWAWLTVMSSGVGMRTRRWYDPSFLLLSDLTYDIRCQWRPWPALSRGLSVPHMDNDFGIVGSSLPLSLPGTSPSQQLTYVSQLSDRPPSRWLSSFTFLLDTIGGCDQPVHRLSPSHLSRCSVY